MNSDYKMNLVHEFLEYQAEHAPQSLAVIQEHKSETYYSLNEKSSAFAEALSKLGVCKGDRIIILGENDSSILIAIFGCLKAGAISVPMHPDTAIEKLEYIVDNCDAKVLITDNLILAGELGKDILIISMYESCYGDVDEFIEFNKLIQSQSAIKREDIKDDDLAAIIYTSGSTGYPKGIMEEHKSIVFSVDSINKVLGYSKEDRVLCGLPLSFDYGLYQVFLSFYAGASLVIIKDFSLPMAIPRILHEFNISVFPLVPSVAVSLLDSGLLERVDLPQLRCITSTGDTFHLEVIKKLSEVLPKASIYPMYGLTECKRVSILEQQFFSEKKDSVGRPIPGTDVYVIDSQGNKLSFDEPGELVVVGPHVMSGYWNDTLETEKRFFVDKESGQKGIKTNDIFSIDVNGFLYYIGRNQMMIKHKGHRISVIEIERVISQIEGVKEVCAFGKPDKHKGQALAVLIYSLDHTVTPLLVKEYFKGKYMRTMDLDFVSVIPERLPKTNNGKIDRQKVQSIMQID